jgi:hypothetical protein
MLTYTKTANGHICKVMNSQGEVFAIGEHKYYATGAMWEALRFANEGCDRAKTLARFHARQEGVSL